MTHYICENFVQDGAIILSEGIVITLWFLAIFMFTLTAVAFWHIGNAAGYVDCVDCHHKPAEEDIK